MNAELLIGAIFSGLAAVVMALTGLMKVMRSSKEDLTENERTQLSYLRALVLVLRENIFRLLEALHARNIEPPDLEEEPPRPAKRRTVEDDESKAAKHRDQTG